MEFCSTRDSGLRASGAQAILQGLAPDGGLYIPVELGSIDFAAMAGMDYPEAAYTVMRHFLPDYDDSFLRKALREAYGDNFGGKAGRLWQLSEDLSVLELWHGPTAAFKDYALQVMPRLLAEARRMRGETGETIILVATSGDTGSAALAGFANLEGIRIAVFYPESGTSVLQRLQMTTQEGKNVSVYGVRGNFDDAQGGVKRAFTSRELAEALAAGNAKLSSANSINWGRLMPQIVYYATSYLALCTAGRVAYGDAVDYCVPTGNFGDIMAGWYAKKLGLPIGRLVCASNKNNVLSEFLESGRYNARREFHKTSSPSMDILVSSNLERLLFHACGSDAQVRQWMAQLTEEGGYTVPQGVMEAIRQSFVAGWVPEEEVFAEIRRMEKEAAYLCDPHTAVAFAVGRGAALPGRPMVVLSTASPYKFPRQVLGALGRPVPGDEFEALDALAQASGFPVPEGLASLAGKAERFTEVIDPAAIPEIPLRCISAGQ